MEKVQRGEVIKRQQNVTKKRKKKLLRSHNRKRATRKQPVQTDTIQQKEEYRGLREFPGTCEDLIVILFCPLFKYVYYTIESSSKFKKIRFGRGRSA